MVKNGLYLDSDGEIRYYVDGVVTYMGLIHVNGYYYYIRSSGVAVKNSAYWVTNNNGLMPSDTYHFDEYGRMTNPVTDEDFDVAMSTHDKVSETLYFDWVLDANNSTAVTYTYTYNGGSLTQMTAGGDTLSFAYDGAGKPMAVTWNGTTYLYLTNIQGDVIAILDTDGNAVVQYTYDAWGNILTTTGTLAETLGTLNPLTYRGYVYDQETQLYYLQSRYYNPTVGRFINADALVSTGQGLLGNNMFAYCNNNPINLLDPAGTVCCALFDDNQLLHLNMQVYFGGGGGGHASGGVSTCGRSITIKEYLDSSDPEVVFENLEKYGMAYYNGVFVIETPFDASFSYGFIGFSVYQLGNVGVLKHEYGHTKQFEEKGILQYTFDVATPSVLINILARADKLPYDYYSYPFEAEANALAGIKLTDGKRPPLPEGGYSSIWDLIVLFFD